MLQEYGVVTVRGNHDRWLLEGRTGVAREGVGLAARAYLASLPATLAFDTPAGRLLLCHGLGEDDMARLCPYDEGYALEANHALHALVGAAEYRLVIGGHTHHRMVRSLYGATFINPGTLLREHGQALRRWTLRTESCSFSTSMALRSSRGKGPLVVISGGDNIRNRQ